MEIQLDASAHASTTHPQVSNRVNITVQLQLSTSLCNSSQNAFKTINNLPQSPRLQFQAQQLKENSDMEIQLDLSSIAPLNVPQISITPSAQNQPEELVENSDMDIQRDYSCATLPEAPLATQDITLSQKAEQLKNNMENSNMDIQDEMSSNDIQNTSSAISNCNEVSPPPILLPIPIPKPIPTSPPPRQDEQKEEVTKNTHVDLQRDLSLGSIIINSLESPPKDTIASSKSNPPLAASSNLTITVDQISVVPVSESEHVRPEHLTSDKQLRLVRQHLFNLELAYPLKVEFASNTYAVLYFVTLVIFYL